MAWRLYQGSFIPVAGSFTLVFLILTPLPRLLAFEVPLVARIPLGVLLQITAPAFGGTLALVASTLLLADPRGPAALGDRFRARLAPAFRVSLLAAFVASALLLVPYAGLLLSFLLMPVVMGPPIVAQVVALEDTSVRGALTRARQLVTGNSGRVILYLLNVGVGIGIASVFLVGGAGYLALDASEPVRVLIGSVYQSVVLGILLGFVAAFEFVIYTELTSAGDASPG